MMALRAALALVVIAITVGPGTAHASPAHAPRQATGVLVETIPPIPGVRVELDGIVATTDDDGRIVFPDAETKQAGRRVQVLDTELLSDDGQTRYRFLRTYGRSSPIRLAWNTDQKVSFEFETVNGVSIGPDELTSLHLKSSVGAILDDVPMNEPVWLHGSRVVTRRTGPEESAILWSVDRVMVGDSNVVNRSQTRFEPLVTPHVQVPVLFFDAHFTTRDAFFGFPAGTALLLTHPDGRETRHPFVDGELTLTALPRGEYVTVVEGPGLHLERPVALTRNQDVELKLFSWLDVGLVGLVLVTFLTVPLLIGTRRRRRLRAGNRDDLRTKERTALRERRLVRLAMRLVAQRSETEPTDGSHQAPAPEPMLAVGASGATAEAPVTQRHHRSAESADTSTRAGAIPPLDTPSKIDERIAAETSRTDSSATPPRPRRVTYQPSTGDTTPAPKAEQAPHSQSTTGEMTSESVNLSPPRPRRIAYRPSSDSQPSEIERQTGIDAASEPPRGGRKGYQRDLAIGTNSGSKKRRTGRFQAPARPRARQVPGDGSNPSGDSLPAATPQTEDSAAPRMSPRRSGSDAPPETRRRFSGDRVGRSLSPQATARGRLRRRAGSLNVYEFHQPPADDGGNPPGSHNGHRQEDADVAHPPEDQRATS